MPARFRNEALGVKVPGERRMRASAGLVALSLALLIAWLALAPRAEAFVYWKKDAETWRANLDGTSAHAAFSIAPGLGICGSGLDVDSAHIYLGGIGGYLTGFGGISRATFDEGDFETLIPFEASATEVNLPCGVAVDGQHIYWGNFEAWSRTYSIGRADLDGTDADPDFIPLSPGIRLAGGLDVDGSHIYWGDSAEFGAGIGRADLDGTDVDPDFIPVDEIVMTPQGPQGSIFNQPRDVVVDGTHIYWARTNSVLDVRSIGRADLDGTDIDQDFIPLREDDDPCGIAVNGSHIYWADSVQGIGRADLDGTDVDQDFIPGSGNCSVALDAGSLASPPPQTTITAGPNGPNNDRTPTFSFTSSKPESSFECSVDGGEFGPCSGNGVHTTSELEEGAHTFRVRARDSSDTADPTPAKRSFTVDVTAPGTQITEGPGGGETVGPGTFFRFEASGAAIAFRCQLDAEPWNGCASPEIMLGLAEGAHTFRVAAVDAAGNEDATPAESNFNVDATAPETTLTREPKRRSRDRTPTVKFVANDPGAKFVCQLDARDLKNCTSPTKFTVGPGRHRIAVRAFDSWDNPEPTAATTRFRVLPRR